MAQKPNGKPKPEGPKKTSTGKRSTLTSATKGGSQVFSTPPKLTAYEKEMGFKVVKMTTGAGGNGSAGKTYYVVKATKPGQAKYMASGGTRRPKGRKGGNPPASRPDAPGSRPTNPGLPGLPGWRPWPGP